MGAVTLALATLLSLAPACLGWLPGRGWSPEGSSFAALAALPWIALAGLPRPPASAGGRAGPLAVAAAALAPLLLGGALDLRAGVPPGTAAWTVVWGLAATGCLAAAAERGRRGRPLAFALAWLALVPLPAAWLAAGGGGPWVQLGPLAWFAGRVGEPPSPGLAAVPWAAAAGVAALAAIAGGRRSAP